MAKTAKNEQKRTLMVRIKSSSSNTKELLKWIRLTTVGQAKTPCITIQSQILRETGRCKGQTLLPEFHTAMIQASWSSSRLPIMEMWCNTKSKVLSRRSLQRKFESTKCIDLLNPLYQSHPDSQSSLQSWLLLTMTTMMSHFHQTLTLSLSPNLQTQILTVAPLCPLWKRTQITHCHLFCRSSNCIPNNWRVGNCDLQTCKSHKKVQQNALMPI